MTQGGFYLYKVSPQGWGSTQQGSKFSLPSLGGDMPIWTPGRGCNMAL